jgi:hypothetical protein
MSEHDENLKDPQSEPTNGLASTSAPLQPDDLHDLFATSDEDDPVAAMRDDPNYGALIKELEYIASEARRLFDPIEETPSDEVWDKIRKELGKSTDA